MGREVVIRSGFTHSLFELFFLILAFIIGYAIYHEYAISKKWRNFYLVLAFFSMGLNDFLHVLFENDTVLPDLFHFFSVFSGALFLTLCALSVKNDTGTAPRRVVLAALFGAVLALCASIALSALFFSSSGGVADGVLYKISPAPQTSGDRPLFLLAFHTIPAVMLLIPGFLFLKYFRETDDLVYFVFSLLSLLFSESELFLAFFREWSPGWWCSHLIKFDVYSGLGIGIVHVQRRSFYELRASREKFRSLAHEVTRAYEDLRDTQEKLIETEKMASIGRLAAAVSHEIRNPLGAIRNSVGVFRNHMQCSSEDAELFDIIDKEISRLNKLATDFLEFARPAPLNKQKANLHRLIEDALCLLFPDDTARGSIEMEAEFDPVMPEFFVDKDAMNQVLWNILTNAVQAMPGGGTLTLKTAYKVTMLNDWRYREASIVVSDTGWGMTGETLARAFQPFFSTKARGSGIGLSIVQRVVRQHGGNVSMTSVVGEGTTVTINLPVE
jgi:signal transduction histidine kinase